MNTIRFPFRSMRLSFSSKRRKPTPSAITSVIFPASSSTVRRSSYRFGTSALQSRKPWRERLRWPSPSERVNSASANLSAASSPGSSAVLPGKWYKGSLVSLAFTVPFPRDRTSIKSSPLEQVSSSRVRIFRSSICTAGLV